MASKDSYRISQPTDEGRLPNFDENQLDQKILDKFKSRADFFARRKAKQEAIQRIKQSLFFKYKSDDEGGNEKHSADEIFFGSMLFMSMVAATLFILLICMVKKRSQRLKNLEAFKTGQKIMMQEDAEFTKSVLGKELRRQLILGDINQFEEISKKEEAKREESQVGLNKMKSLVTNTIKLKRVTDLFSNASPEIKKRSVKVKRSSTLTSKRPTKDLTELDDSLLLDNSLLNDSVDAQPKNKASALDFKSAALAMKPNKFGSALNKLSMNRDQQSNDEVDMFDAGGMNTNRRLTTDGPSEEQTADKPQEQSEVAAGNIHSLTEDE